MVDKLRDTEEEIAWDVVSVKGLIGAQTVECWPLKDPFSRPLDAIVPRDTHPEKTKGK